MVPHDNIVRIQDKVYCKVIISGSLKIFEDCSHEHTSLSVPLISLFLSLSEIHTHVFLWLQEMNIFIICPTFGVLVCTLSWSTMILVSDMWIILTSSYKLPRAIIVFIITARWPETQVRILSNIIIMTLLSILHNLKDSSF